MRTIESVSSFWVFLGAVLFPLGLLASARYTWLHIGASVVGGFTLFCLAVSLPLYSSIVGGRPRGAVEWGLALSSYILSTVSAVAMGAGLWRQGLLALALSMLAALVFTLIQVSGAKPPRARVASIPVPFIVALASIAYSIVVGMDPLDSLIVYGFWFAPLLVMVVGGVFLKGLYGGGRYIIHHVIVAVYVAGLTVHLSYSWRLGAAIAGVAMLLHILYMSPWRGPGLRIKSHIGHMSQVLGPAAMLFYIASEHDMLNVMHVALLSFALPGVYTQAPLLAPMIVSSTWRRKRWIGLSPLIASLAGIVRPVLEDLSLLLLSISYIILLAELNPSPRRIYYIIRYGTEEGYLRSYLDAVKQS